METLEFSPSARALLALDTHERGALVQELKETTAHLLTLIEEAAGRYPSTVAHMKGALLAAPLDF